MNALRQNDFPEVDAGLHSMCGPLAVIQHDTFLETTKQTFVSSAHDTADNFSTSFYGAAPYGKSWHMETPFELCGR
jgi:hypothetical protein